MFDPTTLTGIHTWLSLFAIALGVPAVAGLFCRAAPTPVQGGFLILAFLTSATGFLFPFNGILPSHVVGAIALLTLVPAAFAWIGPRRAGRLYAGTVVASLYFLVFVGVAQAFAKVPALKAMAPTQSEPPFAVAQGIVLLVFIAIGVAAVRHRAERRGT